MARRPGAQWLVLSLVALLLSTAPEDASAAGRPPARAAAASRLKGAAHPARPRGVMLSWSTAREVDTLGFDVVRARPARHPRSKHVRLAPKVKLSKRLVAGSALDLVAITRTRTSRYRFYDRAGRKGDRYYVVDEDLDGRRRFHGPYVAGGRRVARRASSPALTRRPRPGSAGAAGGAASPGSVPLAPPAPTIVPGTPPATAQLALAGRQTVRIGVTEAGWQRVALDRIRDQGVDTSAPADLHLFTGGREVAARIADGALEFYGTPVDTPDTGERAYVVEAEDGPGLRMATAPADPEAPDGPGDVTASSTRMDRTTYAASLRNGEATNFYGNAVFGTTPGRQTVSAPDLASAQGARLTVRLQGLGTIAHSFAVALNGRPLGTVDGFSGQEQGTGTFAADGIVDGDNTVTLTGSGSTVLVAGLTLTYRRALSAEDDELAFTAPGGRRMRVTGFTSPDVAVADVTDPAAPVLLPAAQTADGTARATAPGAGQRQLLAFAPGSRKVPEDVAVGHPSGLHDPGNAADLLVLTRPDLVSALQPLVDRRRAEGLAVQVVDVQDVYDEFSFGQADHAAISALLGTARSSWARAPAYVLLGGDGSYDPRGFLGHGSAAAVVPTQLFDTATSETVSDSDLVGTLAVGRLPAQTPAQMQALVTKTLAYQDAPPRRTAVLASDVDDTWDFTGSNDQIAALLPADAAITRIERGSQPDAATLLDGALAAGPALVNYAGHGSVDLWRGDLLTAARARSLPVGAGPSLYVLMTCLNGFFASPTLDSLAEELLAAPGGAAAVFSSTATTTPGPQEQANQALVAALTATPAPRLGDAIVAALTSTYDPDVRRSWTLLGDPTLPVGLG